MTNPIGSPPPLLYQWCRSPAKRLDPTLAAVRCARQSRLLWHYIARITRFLHAHLAGGVCGQGTLSSRWVWLKGRVHERKTLSTYWMCTCCLSFPSAHRGRWWGRWPVFDFYWELPQGFPDSPHHRMPGCTWFLPLLCQPLWLTTISPTEQFITPRPGTIKAVDEQRSRASQCHVCLRDRWRTSCHL